MAKINATLKADIESLREQKGESATVSWLMQNFKWWMPVYNSRGDAKDADKAKKDALYRNTVSLADKVENAVRDGMLAEMMKEEPSGVILNNAGYDGNYDLNDILTANGGTLKASDSDYRDWDITLDEAFEEFTQSLSATYGGAKPRTANRSGGTYTPSDEYLSLKDAVANAFEVSSKGDRASKEELSKALDGMVDAYRDFAPRVQSLKNTLPQNA